MKIYKKIKTDLEKAWYLFRNRYSVTKIKPITQKGVSIAERLIISVPNTFSVNEILERHHGKKITYWNRNICDRNFPVSNLTRGKRYIAEIYVVSIGMNRNDMIQLAKKNNRLLGGVVGMTILTCLYGENIETHGNHFFICPDTMENASIAIGNGCADGWIPQFWRQTDGRSFCIGYNGVCPIFYLVMFTECR